LNLLFRILFPDLNPPYLTVDGFGQFCDKFHDPGIFIRGCNLFNMLLKLFGQLFTRISFPEVTSKKSSILTVLIKQ